MYKKHRNVVKIKIALLWTLLYENLKSVNKKNKRENVATLTRATRRAGVVARIVWQSARYKQAASTRALLSNDANSTPLRVIHHLVAPVPINETGNEK